LAVLGCACSMLALSAAAHAEGSDSLDQVVVTANKTNRSLRDTETSVSVLTADDVEKLSGAQSTYDVIERIPNLVATRSSNNAPAIRGLDGGGAASAVTAFFAGSRPRLNFLVDGRTLTFNEANYIDGIMWDIQQIEVYRGPQSTLQGRNSIGGVIAIKTADPTYDWEGRARVLGGEFHTRQFSGAVGGPIVGQSLAFRVAADYRRENSFVELHPYTELENPQRFSSLNLRGKLLITPESLPDFRTLLTVSYTDAFAPQTLTVKRPFEDKEIAATNTPRFRTRALVGIADTSWKVSDLITLSTFLTATDFRVNRYVNVGNGIAQIDGTELTAEPRIRLGQDGDTLSGFLALYVFHSQQHEAIDLFGGGTFRDETLTKAVFGEATYRPGDLLEITFGARFEEEDRDRVGGDGPFVIDYHKTFKAFLPRGTVSLHLDENVIVGATVGKGYNAGGAGFGFNAPFPSFTYDKETVWNYEAFVRASAFDKRLRLSANVFYNDYSGLQLPFDIAQNPAAPATVIRNAPRATTYGAEMDARLHAMDGLDVFASAGLLQTKVNKYDDPSVQGRDLPRSPAFSLSAGFTATPIENLDLSFDVRYTDSYYSDVFNNARGKTDPYAIANAQIGYRYHGARLFLSCTNLFNKEEPIFITTGSTAAADVTSLVHSRQVTAGVEMTF
jgi:outer membrane receptor protein involved in Fe transport